MRRRVSPLARIPWMWVAAAVGLPIIIALPLYLMFADIPVHQAPAVMPVDAAAVLQAK